jgi:hypothetical protein
VSARDGGPAGPRGAGRAPCDDPGSDLERHERRLPRGCGDVRHRGRPRDRRPGAARRVRLPRRRPRRRRLTALCDRELDLGGGPRYRQLGPFAFFYASDLDNAGCTEECDFDGVEAVVYALGSIAQTFGAGAPTVPTLELLAQLLRPGRGMPMVFLKQLPCADGTWDCAYQAILEGEIEITGPQAGGLLPGRHEIRLLDCWSHQIANTLGLRVAHRMRGDLSYSTLPVLLAAWSDFEGRVTPAQVVASAGR